MPKNFEGKGKKRRKNFYVQFQKKQRVNTLEPGIRGFLLTCNNDEKRCVREAYNMLNEFASEQEECSRDDAEPQDVDEELQKELTELKNESSEGRTFQQVYTGIQCCLFIQSKLDPCPILLRILEDMRTKGQQKTIATQKMFPVLTTCKPYLDNLRKALKDVIEGILLDKELYQTEEKLQYAVLFRARHNNSLTKDEVVTTVIDAVRSEGIAWEPEPRNPDCAISVDVLSNVCCISILPHYKKYKRYNLVELGKETSAQGDEKEGATDTSNKQLGEEGQGQTRTVDKDTSEAQSQKNGNEVDNVIKDDEEAPSQTSPAEGV